MLGQWTKWRTCAICFIGVFVFESGQCAADLVVLADFGSNAPSSQTATANDFVNLGVTGLTGNENVVNISGQNGGTFSTATRQNKQQNFAEYQVVGPTDSFVSSWNGGEIGLFRTFSLTDAQENLRLSNQNLSSSEASSALTRDYIHLTRDTRDLTSNQSRQVQIRQIGLESSKRYRLYLFGNLGEGLDKNDSFFTESQFQPLNNSTISFENNNKVSGRLEIEFQTSADFQADDSIDFLWELNDGVQFGTLNGFAVTEISSVPEPSCFLLCLGIVVGIPTCRRSRFSGT